MKNTLAFLLFFLCTVALFSQPVIDSIDPVSGSVGTIVTVSGSGFSAENNTVSFQDADMDAIWEVRIPASSSDGNTIRFTVPEYINPECYYDTPPCAAPSIQTQPGPFFIWVETSSGKSTIKQFDVTAAATPAPPSSSPPPGDYSLSVTLSGITSTNVTVTVNPPGSTNTYPIFVTYTEPTNVTLTANDYTLPDGSVEAFTQWSGDLAESTNPITILVDELKTVTAVYVHGDPTPPPEDRLGDVDGSGRIDIVDALLVAQYYVGLIQTFAVPQNADVNCDGNVTIIDALLIARYYVGILDEFCKG
ncbi:MAG: IPT/TIG domain-containing protein [Spirochaetales bacterium]|nr:IPT/TIG domain-containing protein [Spirochaetales bacterium]